MDKRKRKNIQTVAVRYSEVKKRHKQLGFGELALTKDQFKTLTDQVCHYCQKHSEGRSFTGLDRIDNTQGYAPANVVPCCKQCNYQRQDWTIAEHLGHSVDVLAHVLKTDPLAFLDEQTQAYARAFLETSRPSKPNTNYCVEPEGSQTPPQPNETREHDTLVEHTAGVLGSSASERKQDKGKS